MPSVSISQSPELQSAYVWGSSRTPARNAALSTPARWNMTDAASMSSRGVACVGAPARKAMSASPVASITRLPRTASRPALDSVTTPRTSSPVQHRRDHEPVQHGVHSGLLDQEVRHELEPLGIDLVGLRLALGNGGTELVGADLELAPQPFASTVCSCRYQAIPSTPTAVRLPPKQPNLSTRVTETPGPSRCQCRGESAGPEPTTRTSVSWTTSTSRAGSRMVVPMVRR